MTNNRYTAEDFRSRAQTLRTKGYPGTAQMLLQAAEDCERLDKYREAMKHIRDSSFRSAVQLRGYASARIEIIDTARTQEKANG